MDILYLLKCVNGISSPSFSELVRALLVVISLNKEDRPADRTEVSVL